MPVYDITISNLNYIGLGSNEVDFDKKLYKIRQWKGEKSKGSGSIVYLTGAEFKTFKRLILLKEEILYS